MLLLLLCATSRWRYFIRHDKLPLLPQRMDFMFCYINVPKTKKKVWHQERQIMHTEIFLGRIDTWIIKQCPRFTQWLYVRRGEAGEAGGGCDLSGLQQRILLLRVLFHCRRFRCLSSGLLSLKRSRYHHKPLAFNQSSVTVTVASPEMDSNTHT